MDKKKLNDLSKVISYILRHNPKEYAVKLDEEGWVSINQLMLSIKNYHMNWGWLNEIDLITMVNTSEKKRHEIKGEYIRALYGHSFAEKIKRKPQIPPEILYHGTSIESAKIISREGLKKMNRQYVHLFTNKESAKQIGFRRSSKPTVVIVEAKKAYQQNIKFYLGNENIWLSEDIPLDFISFDNIK